MARFHICMFNWIIGFKLEEAVKKLAASSII